jgi:hypothetical protein
MFCLGRQQQPLPPRAKAHDLRSLPDVVVGDLDRGHPSAVGRTGSDDVAVDFTRRPGQQVIAQTVDILAAFRGMHDREVVALSRPKTGVAVDPEIRGGCFMCRCTG